MPLTEQEKQEVVRYLEADKPLPDKFRFLLFEDKREVELVWNGKSGEVSNIVLPFQVIERISFLDMQGQVYTAVRVGNGNSSRLLSDGKDTGVTVGRRFRLTVFGQRELQQLGDGQAILREFVASTSGEEWEGANARETAIREELERLNGDLLQGESVLRRLEDKEGDLADHREKLEQARRAGAEELLKRGELLNAIRLKVQTALGWPAELRDSLKNFTSHLPSPDVPEAEGVPKAIAKELAHLEKIADPTTMNLSSEIEASIKALEAPHQAWEEYMQKASDDIAGALAAIGISDAQELTWLQSRAAELGEELKGLPSLRDTLSQLEKKRAACLDDLAGVARSKSRIIEESARILNQKLSGRVRLIVEPLADKSQVLAWLRESLQGANISGIQLSKLVEHPTTSIAAAVRNGTAALRKLDCSATTGQKIIERLDNKQLRELEELPCPDRIAVEVNLGTPDSEIWKRVEEVSPGQRATALLALVLLSSTKPLIIDQPEDDLDNQHIYQDVVRVLAEVCQHRQVIVATHNANIPVLGDAELLVALEANAERSRVKAIGGFEDPRIASYARQILEGGEDAFRARLRRYRPYGTTG